MELTEFFVVLIENLDVGKRDVAYCHVKEVIREHAGLIFAVDDVGSLIELLGESGAEAVPLDGRPLGPSHELGRHGPEEMSDPGARFQDPPTLEAEMLQAAVDRSNSGWIGVVRVGRRRTSGRILLFGEEFAEFTKFFLPGL